MQIERFLLGSWLEAAKSRATNIKESKQYEYNARTQITLWGPNGEVWSRGECGADGSVEQRGCVERGGVRSRGGSMKQRVVWSRGEYGSRW